MKTKLFSLIVMAFMLVSVGVANSATTLMEVGRSPFHKPPLKTADELRTMLQSKVKEVEKGFSMAGRKDLFQPFMTQVATTQIDTVEFPKGSYFEWMFYKKNGIGTVRVVKDVTWGNNKPFLGFQFNVEHNGMIATFVIPLGCGNVALMGESKIPEVVKAPVVIPNQAPKCAMTVAPTKAFCGEVITVDARNSSDVDGSIAKMKIVVVDDGGKVVSEKMVDGPGLVGEVAMPCGNSTVKVTVTDDKGTDATSAQCVADVTGMKRIRLIGDVGYYRQFDPGHYLFGRVGGEYRFNEDWSILGLLGGAWLFEGRDGTNAFLADVLGEYKFGSRFFVDLGVGGWITDGDDDLETENTQLDLIAAVGVRVFGEPEGFNGSVFLEARSAFDELDGLYDYGRFGVGMRFRF